MDSIPVSVANMLAGHVPSRKNRVQVDCILRSHSSERGGSPCRCPCSSGVLPPGLPCCRAPASIGLTSTHHLGLEWLKSLTGIDMLAVPYRGVAPVLVALVANEVQLGVRE